MHVSFFTFPTDIIDEGYDHVLHQLTSTGADRVALACSYHHARDIFPHNPKRVVYYHEGNVVFFHPDTSRYRGLRLQPRVSKLAESCDVLGKVTEHAARYDVEIQAWLIFLHDFPITDEILDCVVRNAFDDPYITQLCPTNPEVQAYAIALAQDVARYGVQAILAESIGYGGFDHGYHHERSFISLTPIARFLLGICFCKHCVSLASAHNIDAKRVREFVRTLMKDVLHEKTVPWLHEPLTWSTVSAALNGELGRYLLMQQKVVTDLIRNIQEAIKQATPANTSLIPIDLSGATLGYLTGTPPENCFAAEVAWREGLDLYSLATITKHLAILGYVRDPARLAQEVAVYRKVVPPDTILTVALRPLLPDCPSPENLREKMRLLRVAGVDDIAFYHYGLMSHSRLAWVRDILFEDSQC